MAKERNTISVLTGAVILFLFKACKQAHSLLCKCLHNAEEGQKNKPDGELIVFRSEGIIPGAGRGIEKLLQIPLIP